MKNLLTFDVEEYFQVQNLESSISCRDWEKFESRLHVGLDVILKVLSDFDARATFFVLGWIAERHPDVIRSIAERGHEIGSHGYSHELIYNMSPDEFREDLNKSIDILEGILGESVRSYRAPCFSITGKSLWALDILLESGIRYDSSIFPIHHHRYGIPDAIPYPHVIREKDDGTLTEFPVSTCGILGKRLPFSGGGYFRLLPIRLVTLVTSRLNGRGHPVVTYLHPWEFDPGQPRIRTSRLNAFRHYLNLHRTEEKLRFFLDRFEVQPLGPRRPDQAGETLSEPTG